MPTDPTHHAGAHATARGAATRSARGAGPAPRSLDVLLGGLDAAALVLATVFLASGAVRREVDTFAWGIALLALAGGAAAAARWMTDERLASPGWRRAGRALLVLTGGFAVVLAVRGAHALWLVAGGGPRGAAPLGEAAPTSRLLLVTLAPDAAEELEAGKPGSGERFAGGALHGVADVLHGSPRRDAALASILTGLEVIEHRVVFEGDAPHGEARTAAEVLGDLGFRAAAFGAAALPPWVLRGVSDRFDRAGLREAVAWLGRPGRSFAHVHVAARAAFDPGSLTDVAALPGARVVVVALPAGGEGVLDVAAARARVLTSGPAPAAAGPRSTTAILPTLLDAAGVGWRPRRVPRAPLGGRPEADLAVCFRHGREDEVHRAVALSAGAGGGGAGGGDADPWGAGAVGSALEITRLPGGRLDDWSVGGGLEGHLVYRTGVRPLGDPRDIPAAERTGLLQAFAGWRDRNCDLERATAPVGAAIR